MSIETEIQKTISDAVQRAMDIKGDPRLGLPVLALLVGAPVVKTREATLIDTFLGITVGAMIDRGDSNEKILGRVEEALRLIRGAIADPDLIERYKAVAEEIRAK
jgi:hypothetical protein